VSSAPLTDIPSLLGRLDREGERPALSYYRGRSLAGRLSYRELGERVESLTARLHGEFGVSAGDRIAMLTPNRLEVPVYVLALLQLGAVVVPLNPGSAPEDWAYALEHSGARGLCATRELDARVPSATRPAFTIDVEEPPPSRASGGRRPGPSDPLGEQLAVVLYTSGTTGNPKGVALRQRNLLANAWSMGQNFELDGTTQLAVLPLYHAHAFGFGLMTALCTGGHLVFSDGLDPFSWAEVIRIESVQVTSVVPTLLPLLLAAGVTSSKVPTLRHILVSSAPLPGELARDFEARARIPLIQGWGLSEYTNFACCITPQADAADHARWLSGWEVPSVGPALRGTEVRVIDAEGAAAAEGVAGELVVRGHSTMAGYYRDPENTAGTIDADGWLHTGDQGFFRLDNGQAIFFVTGRLKEIIIRDAEKYSPLALERRLVESAPELLGRLVVVGFAHQTHGEEIGAYVEGDVDAALEQRLSPSAQRSCSTGQGRSRGRTRGKCSVERCFPGLRHGAHTRGRSWSARCVREHHPITDAVFTHTLEAGVGLAHRRELDLRFDPVLGSEPEHLAHDGRARDVASAHDSLTREKRRGRKLQ
jgi:long-chain acyl-CoA synthetase